VRVPGQSWQASRQHPAAEKNFWRFGQMVKTKKTIMVNTFFLKEFEPLG
jgi:hypothetical protein